MITLETVNCHLLPGLEAIWRFNAPCLCETQKAVCGHLFGELWFTHSQVGIGLAALLNLGCSKGDKATTELLLIG